MDSAECGMCVCFACEDETLHAVIEHEPGAVRVSCECGAAGSWVYYREGEHKKAMDEANTEWEMLCALRGEVRRLNAEAEQPWGIDEWRREEE